MDWITPPVLLTAMGLFLTAGIAVAGYVKSNRDELAIFRQEFNDYRVKASEMFVSYDVHGKSENRLIASMDKLERAVEKLSDRLEKLLER